MSSNPILYNVTVHVDNTVEKDWVEWMQSKHIPDVINTGCFLGAQFNKILHESEDGSASYAIQYKLESMQHFEKYNSEFAQPLQKEHIERYGQKCIAIRTLLEELKLF